MSPNEVVNAETGEITAADADLLNYDVHPVAALFPYIDGAAFDEFVADIRTNGQLEPVVLDPDGRLLDGRNRARACQVLGIDVKEIRYSGDDAESWIISHNVHRRHLKTGQRSMIAGRLADLKRGGDRRSEEFKGSDDPLNSSPRDEHTSQSIHDAAAALSVGTASVKRAKAVLKSGDTDLIKAVESGEVTVTTAAARVQPPKVRKTADAVAERWAKVTDLARQGYSSRQIAPMTGMSEQGMRAGARKRNIEIPADKVIGRSRRIDSADVVRRIVEGLESTSTTIDLIDWDAINPAMAEEWLTSLNKSLSRLKGFRNQIEKKASQT